MKEKSEKKDLKEATGQLDRIPGEDLAQDWSNLGDSTDLEKQKEVLRKSFESDHFSWITYVERLEKFDKKVLFDPLVLSLLVHKKNILLTLFKKATGQKDTLILMQAFCAFESFICISFRRFLNGFDSKVLFKPLIYCKLIKSKEGTACLLQKAQDFSEQFPLLKNFWVFKVQTLHLMSIFLKN